MRYEIGYSLFPLVSFLLSSGILRCQPHERQVRITLPRFILILPVFPGTR